MFQRRVNADQASRVAATPSGTIASTPGSQVDAPVMLVMSSRSELAERIASATRSTNASAADGLQSLRLRPPKRRARHLTRDDRGRSVAKPSLLRRIVQARSECALDEQLVRETRRGAPSGIGRTSCRSPVPYS